MEKVEEHLSTFRSESSSDEEQPKKPERSSPTDEEINILVGRVVFCEHSAKFTPGVRTRSKSRHRVRLRIVLCQLRS
ncbi:hypothetical protein Y032_0955g3201 [Ancylostoma ceylanicum]|uniref:Uncharacterized protein n=1 Tax=Ancylostoma ceylanicum TaxID=53326 RepID=A0A016W9I5_9BILA|nr:hypothetical protein Y032_0955g3201 [Ancylostoma ceylanicum]